MTRKQELEVLIPRSKMRCHDESGLDKFQMGLFNLDEVKELQHEVNYLVNLMEEYDKLTEIKN